MREELFKLRDEEYAEFHSRLVPNIERASIIGIRVPNIRKTCKEV